jgi:carbon-monoxide dehydrogenase medium subunit
VRIGISGAGPVASRAAASEAALTGQQPTEEALRGAAEQAADGIDALEDIHSSAVYRLHLVRVMTRRALELAASRARA